MSEAFDGKAARVAPPARAVLFDVDGTLVDTAYLHAICWSEAFDQHDRHVSMAEIHRAVGMGADKLIPHLLGGSTASHDDLVATHRTLWTTWWTRVQPTNGARELVAACAAAGSSVALASSASAAELQAMRRVLDIDEFIEATTDSSTVQASKPDPDLFAAALDRTGSQPADALCVGDSVWDAEAAAKLGIRFVGLLCGGTSEAELRAAGAAETFKDPAALLESMRPTRA